MEAEAEAGARRQGGPSSPGPAPASFSEILSLVRSGRELPGLRRPHVTASLASPTASRLPRRPKPWEPRSAEHGPESPRQRAPETEP